MIERARSKTTHRTWHVALAWALLSIWAAPMHAQIFPTDDAVIERMWEEGMEEGSQVFDLAQALLDSIGPRLMGTPGYDGAGDWLLDRYRDWGIEASKDEYGTWEGWERDYTHIDLRTPRKRSLEGTLLAWSPGTDGPVEGEVVILPTGMSGTEMEQWLPSAEGKFVATSFPQPTCRPDESWIEWATEDSFVRMSRARQEAARAFQTTAQAFRQANGAQRLEEIGALGLVTGNWSRGWGVDKIFSSATREIPSVHLSCEDYGLLARLAERDQNPRIRLDAGATARGDVPAFNVVASIPGTELPDEYVLLMAHMDSWDGASGATDNGTGTLMMLEAMRILKAAYPNPRRTIMVGHWGGEEQGLVGSTAFAADRPEVVDGLQAGFNQDNGTWRVNYIRMQGFLGAGAHFAQWFSKIPREIKQHIELDIPGFPESGGSDHMSFICKPAPGFRLQSSYPDYRQNTWHTNRDTFDKVVFDDLRNNATLAAMLAYMASEDPERVPTVQRVLPPEGTIRPAPDQTSIALGSWPQCRPPRRSAG